MASESGQGRGSGQGVFVGHFALVLVQLCFGLFPVFAIRATGPEGWAPGAVAFWRISCGALALGGVAFLLYRRKALPSLRDAGRLAICSLLGVTANQWLYLEGVSRSTAVHAGLVMGLIPVFTFVVAFAVRQEKLEWLRAIGVTVAFAGALSLVLGGEAVEFERYGFGDLLMIANAFCYATYLVLSKPLLERHPPLVVIGWVYVFALPMLPFLLGEDPIWPENPAPEAVMGLAYTLVFATVVGYLLNTFALARLRASTTAVYVYSQPLISGLAGMWMLGEELSSAAAWAGACILVGIYLVSKRRPARRVEPSPAAIDGRASDLRRTT